MPGGFEENLDKAKTNALSWERYLNP
jgi:hypothetical protein